MSDPVIPIQRLTRRAALASTAGLFASACVKAQPWTMHDIDAQGGIVELDLNEQPRLATPGGMAAFKVSDRRVAPILVMRIENNEFRVLSLRCPHLGCTVRWDDDLQQLICPCHRSLFDDRGRRIEGPAKRSLSTHRWSLMGTHLRISVT